MAMQFHRRDPFLVLGHEVDGLEPHGERQFGGIEDGAGGDRGLAVAAIALLEFSAGSTGTTGHGRSEGTENRANRAEFDLTEVRYCWHGPVPTEKRIRPGWHFGQRRGKEEDARPPGRFDGYRQPSSASAWPVNSSDDGSLPPLGGRRQGDSGLRLRRRGGTRDGDRQREGRRRRRPARVVELPGVVDTVWLSRDASGRHDSRRSKIAGSVHAWVGCAVTLRYTIRRRSCLSTTST